MGILAGITFFIIILALLSYLQTDFDQKLIIAVNNEEPTSILITQIEDEAARERSKAKNNLLSNMLDRKFWFQIDSFNESDIQFSKGVYIRHMKFINEQEELRKDLVTKKINVEEFTLESKRLEELYYAKFF